MNQKIQTQKNGQFEKFQKTYLELLSRIEEIRKRQLNLLQETADKLDKYKLLQLRKNIK